MGSGTPLSSSAEHAERGVQFTFTSSARNQPDWHVQSYTLEESLSAPYTLTLELSADEPAADGGALLGKNASLHVMRDERHALHGIVVGVTARPSAEPHTSSITLRVAPALASLRLRSSSRIFSALGAAGVARELLGPALQAFGRRAEFVLEAEPPALEYVVQHRETDLTFLDALLATHGLYYYFTHAPEDGAVETLVITDSASSASPIVGGPDVELVHDRDAAEHGEVIDSLGRASALASTAVRVRQFDWTNPTRSQYAERSIQEGDVPALARVEHGDVACYDDRAPRHLAHDTERQARLRLEGARVGCHVLAGTSNVTALRPGAILRVEGEEYLLTHVQHVGSTEREPGRHGKRGHYRNRFTCIPRSVPFRAAPARRARIHGPQTALVVDERGSSTPPRSGADGNDIVVDAHGRVRVKFSWDTSGSPPSSGGTCSAWLRVSQLWAGHGWGTQFWPRVGSEVLVQFIDGDPDRPIISGALYNGLCPPPHAAALRTSGLQTQSSVDPTRHNSWSFVDTNESEEIRTRAQRDYVEQVGHEHHTSVRGAQRQHVRGSQVEQIGGDASLRAQGREKRVNGSEALLVAGQRESVTGGKSRVECEHEARITGKAHVQHTYLDTHVRTVAGTAQLELKRDKLEHVVGSSTLRCDRAHVLKQGATVRTCSEHNYSLDCASTFQIARGVASLTLDVSDAAVFSSSASITLQVGPNRLELGTSGVELSALAIDVTVQASSLALGPASAGLVGTHTTVEASAVCQVRGALLNLN